MRRLQTPPPLRLAVVLALSVCLARPADAQNDRTGRLEGRVIDSTRARPLIGTRVVAVRVSDSAHTSGAASTDSAGKYRIDSLPPGRYAVGFESPFLDSLEINISPRTVTIAPGQTATIDLALPPAAKLRGALCPGVTLPAQTGVLFGHVVNARSENPLSDVVLAMSWQEREVDRTTLRPVIRERTESVMTDAGGWYRLCGVPTDTWLSLQLQYLDRTGPVIRALIGDTLGIAVRHLSFDASTAQPASDSAASVASTDSSATPLLSGTAMLSGVVRGTGDLPLASAEVRVRGARATGRTDAFGRYSLSALPAGTQMLDVRRVGYSAAELPIELRSGVMVTRDVRLQRVVNLDSIRVVSTRQRYKEFDLVTKIGFGFFYGPEKIPNQGVAWTSEVVDRIPGFKVTGTGGRATVRLQQGATISNCAVNIVIDDMERSSINDISPQHIGAIAAYRQYDSGPLPYDRGCGVLMIWRKKSAPKSS